MAKIFDDCPNEVIEMAQQVLERWHQEIVDAKVTFKFLFVEDDGIGPALKHHGYPAAAIIKVNSVQARKEGLTDCTIKIDKSWWDSHSEQQQVALLDHEITHVLVARDDDGKIITDDLSRPKVKLRPHDWSLGGFFEVAKRHLLAAEEVAGIKQVEAQFTQMELNFGAWG